MRRWRVLPKTLTLAFIVNLYSPVIYCQSEEAFPERYFSATLLLRNTISNLRSRFRNLYENSVLHLYEDRLVLDFSGSDNECRTKQATVKVTRHKSTQKMIEKVSVQCGKLQADLTLTRKGPHLIPTPNNNLLFFEFPELGNADFYELSNSKDGFFYRYRVQDKGYELLIFNRQNVNASLIVMEFYRAEEWYRTYDFNMPGFHDPQLLMRSRRHPSGLYEVHYQVEGLNRHVNRSLFDSYYQSTEALLNAYLKTSLFPAIAAFP